MQKLQQYPEIEKRINFTSAKVKKLRDMLTEALQGVGGVESLVVVATGSYGRGEASDESDIDLFIIYNGCEDKALIASHAGIIEKIVSSEIPKPPGSTGTFGVNDPDCIEDLTQNIGGQNDSNVKLTRRMLFLLEGTWLFNEDKFKEYRVQLLQKYIKDDVDEAKLNKFFLNDIIRYYRTITTDFEYKVTEDGKAWGLRNIKLRFSRKLLYFSGIIVAAKTSHLLRSEQVGATIELLAMTPLERVTHICGDSCDDIISPYELFLGKISSADTRLVLEGVKKASRERSLEYRSLREKGREFSQALEKCLHHNFDKNHSIHNSLLF